MINLLTGIESTASALDAERMRMDVISQNIANVNTTKGVDGKPYQRQQVVFEIGAAGASRIRWRDVGPQTVQIARMQKDTRPPRMIYNPGHPDADAREWWRCPTSTSTRKWWT